MTDLPSITDHLFGAKILRPELVVQFRDETPEEKAARKQACETHNSNLVWNAAWRICLACCVAVVFGVVLRVPHIGALLGAMIGFAIARRVQLDWWEFKP